MDIHYRFVASGHNDVENAFAGIEKRARAAKRATDGAGTGGSSPRARANETERLAARVAASQERAARQEVKSADRVAQAAARAKIKGEERAAKHVAGIRDRHFRDDQRKEEKHVNTVAKTRERAVERAARKEAAAKARATKEKREERTKMVGQLADVASGVAVGGVVSAAALAGAASRESLKVQEMAARIAINSRKAGGPLADATDLRRGFERTAINTPGQTAEGVADAVGRFVSLTGDLNTALKSQDTFATVASASGADIGDIAEAAASLSQQFDIKGIEDMRNALAALTFAGKEGSFELKDAAAQFQRLAASGAAFGIPKGVAGVKTLGGLTQIARSGTGSSEQAATAVENLLTNLKVKQKELGAQGVNVFKDGKARDVTDLIVESISKVGGGDMGKKSMGLTQIFGEQGIRAINPLVAKYATAFQGAQGKDGKVATEAERTAAGIAALRAEIQRSINAPGTWADVVEDAAAAQSDSSAQLSGAWQALVASVGGSAVPAILSLSKSLGTFKTFLEDTGMLKDDTKAHKKGSGAAAKAVTAIEADLKAKGISEANADPETKEQLRQLRESAATDAAYKGNRDAKSKAYQDMVAAGASPLEMANAGFKGPNTGPMTSEDFVKNYVGTYNEGDSEEERAAAEQRARDIVEGKGGAGRSIARFFGQSGESDEQLALASRYASEQGQGGEITVGKNQKGDAAINTKDANDAVASFASAITIATAQIVAASQPSNI